MRCAFRRLNGEQGRAEHRTEDKTLVTLISARPRFIKGWAEAVLVEAKPPAILLGKQGDFSFTRLAIAWPDTRQFMFMHGAMLRLLQFLINLACEYLHKRISKGLTCRYFSYCSCALDGILVF